MVTSNFRRSTDRRIWPTPSLKLLESKNSMTSNGRWILDTVPIGFSPSGSCWELCSKANRVTIVLTIIIYELINNKNYLIFFIIRIHLLTNSYVVMKSLGLL